MDMQLFKKTIVYLSSQSKYNTMNNQKLSFTILLLCMAVLGFAQEDEGYVEFNDRNNIVHGVYLGITMNYGEIDKQDTYQAGLKLAYVANQQFEVGFASNFFYSEQGIFKSPLKTEDLVGVYGGLHLEPIFFSKSRVNLSFPLLIGAGAVGYFDSNESVDFEGEEQFNSDNVDAVFVLEPGVNALFNVSRYLQLELGLKYRFSSRIELDDSPVSRINGVSAGLGVKIGVFNMGRNRYKKNIRDEK